MPGKDNYNFYLLKYGFVNQYNIAVKVIIC